MPGVQLVDPLLDLVQHGQQVSRPGRAVPAVLNNLARTLSTGEQMTSSRCRNSAYSMLPWLPLVPGSSATYHVLNIILFGLESFNNHACLPS